MFKKKNRITEVMLLAFSVIVLIFSNAVTYLLLLSKNEEWKALVTEKDNNTSELSEALAEHVYYDGDSIPCNQTVRHYSRSGKLIESVELKDVLKIGRKHLVMMAGIIIIKYR